MEEINAIAAYYHELTVSELLAIAAEPASLRKEVIPVLQKELIARGKPAEALSLSEFLVSRPVSLKEMTMPELREAIQLRIASGEPMESIQTDVKDQGLNLLDIVNHGQESNEHMHAYITALRSEGLSGAALEEKVRTAFDMSEDEAQVLVHAVKQKGTRNIIIGVVLVIGLGLLIVGQTGGEYIVGLRGYIGLGLGAWLIFKGFRQRGEL